MRRLPVPFLLLTLLLTGCGSTGERLRTLVGGNNVESAVDQGGRIIASVYAARPLRLRYLMPASETDQRLTETRLSQVTAAQQADFLGLAVAESMENCGNFVATLTAGQAGFNTASDVTSIVLSGLAAVFTPTATVRALSAASSIVQGSQAAVNSEFYQQLTLVLFVQQINDSYYGRIANFRGRLAGTGASRAQFFAAVTELQEIHRECSIPAIAARIGRTGERPTLPEVGVLPGEIVAGAIFTNAGRTAFRRVAGGRGNTAPWEVQEAQSDGSVAQPPVILFRDTNRNEVVAWLRLRGFGTRVTAP
jgi:hypothetical protein